MKNVWLALPLTAFALSACVTVNIYFPAAAAEKAADLIIEEVWQIKKNGQAAPKPNEGQPPAADTKKEESK